MESREGPFKIWKNPELETEGPRYLGEFYSQEGRLFLQADELRALGFSSGSYTVLVPPSLVFLYDVPKWQRVEI